MFDKNKCSPLEDDNEYSCMDDDIIMDVGKIFNKKLDTNIDMNQCPRVIHKQICDKLSKLKKDKSETCLLDMNNIINELPKDKLQRFKESFRPEQPDEWQKNFNAWLSTTDIDNVLKQYVKDDKELFYTGAVPMDFAECEFPNKLCNFNLKSLLRKGKTKIAIVFNTDDHDESGEHWVSMYIDCKGRNLKEPCIYYYDSAGDKAPEEVMELVEKIKKQGLENGIKFTFLYNDKVHQKGTTECGIYSLHFLIYMIENGNFMKYIKNKKSDEYIEKFRTIFFI